MIVLNILCGCLLFGLIDWECVLMIFSVGIMWFIVLYILNSVIFGFFSCLFSMKVSFILMCGMMKWLVGILFFLVKNMLLSSVL